MEISTLFSLTTEYIHVEAFFTVSLQSPYINSMANSTGTERFSCTRKAQSTRHFLSAVYLVRLRVFLFVFFFLTVHLETRNSDLLFFRGGGWLISLFIKCKHLSYKIILFTEEIWSPKHLDQSGERKHQLIWEMRVTVQGAAGFHLLTTTFTSTAHHTRSKPPTLILSSLFSFQDPMSKQKHSHICNSINSNSVLSLNKCSMKFS